MLAVYRHKNPCHDVTKTNFLKNLSIHLAEILCEYSKVMLYKVLQVLRRYFPTFLSYRESSLGGGVRQPTPQWRFKFLFDVFPPGLMFGMDF